MTSLSLLFFRILIFLSCLHFPFFPFRSNQRYNSVSAVQLKPRAEGEIRAGWHTRKGKIRAGRQTRIVGGTATRAPALILNSPTAAEIAAGVQEKKDLKDLFKKLEVLNTWKLENYKWSHFHLLGQEQIHELTARSLWQKLKNTVKRVVGRATEDIYIWSIIPWCDPPPPSPCPGSSGVIPWPNDPNDDTKNVHLLDEFNYDSVDTQSQIWGIRIKGTPSLWQGELSKPLATAVVAELSDVRAFVDLFKANPVMDRVSVEQSLVPNYNANYEKIVCQHVGGKGSIISPVAVILLDRFLRLLNKHDTLIPVSHKLPGTSKLPIPAQTPPSILQERVPRAAWKVNFVKEWKLFYEKLKVDTDRKKTMDGIIFGLKNEVLGVNELVKLKTDLADHGREARSAGYDVAETLLNVIPFVPLFTPAIRTASDTAMKIYHANQAGKQKYRTLLLDAIKSVLDNALTSGAPVPSTPTPTTAQIQKDFDKNFKVIGGLMLLLNYWRACYGEDVVELDLAAKKALVEIADDDVDVKKIFPYHKVAKTFEHLPAIDTRLGPTRTDVTRAVLIYDGLKAFLDSSMPNHWTEYKDLVSSYGEMAAGAIG